MSFNRKYSFDNCVDNVCYQCQDRHPGCHGTCEKYLAAKAKHEKKVADVKKRFYADKDANLAYINAADRHIKQREKNRYINQNRK